MINKYMFLLGKEIISYTLVLILVSALTFAINVYVTETQLKLGWATKQN